MGTAGINHGNVTITHIDPRLLAGEPTYLFNVYSDEFTRNTGSTGMYYIPPCPDDKEWVRAPQHIDGTVVDTFPNFKEHEHYDAIPVVGDDIVKAVLEGGSKEDDIRKFGVFASQNKKPTAAEVAEANRMLIPELQRQVQEADRFSQSADVAERNSISDKHYRAARRLKQSRPWMSNVTAMSVCPFCSTPVNPGVPKCPNCHEVIDAQAYAAIKAKVGTA